jgi:hypothetical protein
LELLSLEQGMFVPNWAGRQAIVISLHERSLALTKTSSTVLVYAGVFTFLVDCFPLYGASALAANSFLRSSFGGVFPLFGIQSKSPESWMNLIYV